MKDLVLKEFRKYLYDVKHGKMKGYVWGAILGGIGSAFVCSIVYLVVVYLFGHQSWYAVAIGAIVGFSVRWCGRGGHSLFGIIAAVIAGLSCVFADALLELTGDFVLCNDTGCTLSRLFFYLVAAIEAYIIGTKDNENNNQLKKTTS